MRTLFLYIALLCAASTALAADITGNWAGQITTPNGDKMDVKFKFKQEGVKLTGTAVSPHGDAMEITDGKVEGDALSFVVEMKMNGGMKIPHKGKIVGEAIDLEVHFGDDPPMTVKLSRSRD